MQRSCRPPHRWAVWLTLAAGGVPAGPAAAHVTTGTPEAWQTWSADPWVGLPLGIAFALYLNGLRRLWRRAGVGSGIRGWQAGAFLAGWLLAALALLSPLDSLGGLLFSAHMVQHEVLMLTAVPLLVVSAPGVACLWGLPRMWRRGLGRSALWPPLQTAWRTSTRPLAAWSVHALTLWVWHAPILFQAAVESDLVHTLQHLSFVLAAGIFWHAVLRPDGRDGAGSGIAVISVFTTALHSAALGALLTVSGTVWYPVYAGTTASFGLTALDDQRLGGLVMWIPAGLVYLAAALALFRQWLEAAAQSDRQAVAGSSARHEQVPPAGAWLTPPGDH